ncbi:hypothetical protein AAMO2058_001504400 [Amorphochlora amoebiformis]
MADEGSGIVLPTLGLVQYSDDEEEKPVEEKKSAPKKKKEKKKKKKKKRDKKSKSNEPTSTLPSAEDLMAENTLPDFLEEAAKRQKEANLQRMAQTRVQSLNIPKKLTPEESEAAAQQARLIAAKKAKEAERKQIKNIAGGSRKRPFSKTKAGPDPFEGLHPWAKDGKSAVRQKKIKEQQRKKVSRGQTFEGRTWKSEAEMVLRQQFD